MAMGWRRLLPIHPLTWWRALLLAGGAVALASLLRIAFGRLGVDLPFTPYYPAVLVAAVWGGFFGGGVALGGSALVAYFFFMPQALSQSDAALSLLTFLIAGGLMVLVGGALAHAVETIAASEARHRTLAEELGHRAQNGYAVLRAIISQSARSAATVEEFETTVLARMSAMSTAQALVSATPDESADLRALIPTTLAPFDIRRFQLEDDGGAAVLHNRNLAMTIALILHELATNAVKYGALSNPNGKVTVRSERRDGMMQIRWSEAGGPKVADTEARGFGTRLLQSGLRAYGGSGERVLAGEGAVCILVFPA